MRSATLYKILAVLLVLIAAALAVNHLVPTSGLDLDPAATAILGLAAGAGIGVVAAVMGVAGGELLIPTIVLLYGLDIKIAGSLSLLISLPTMLVAFARYSRDSNFGVLRDQARFVAAMALGSITGTVIGGLLLGVVPDLVLIPALAALLLLSAVKIWRHQKSPPSQPSTPDAYICETQEVWTVSPSNTPPDAPLLTCPGSADTRLRRRSLRS